MLQDTHTQTHIFELCAAQRTCLLRPRQRQSGVGTVFYSLKCVWSLCAELCSLFPLPPPLPHLFFYLSRSPFPPLPACALNISTIFIQLRRKKPQKFLLCFRFQHSWPGWANVSAAAAYVSLSAASVKRADTIQNVSAGYAAPAAVAATQRHSWLTSYCFLLPACDISRSILVGLLVN